MREIKFIRNVEIDLLPMGNPDEVRYHMMGPVPPLPVMPDDHDPEFLLADYTIETQVVPVHYLRTGNRNVRDDMYIAYSKEVQELLGMPFDIIRKEKEQMYKHNAVLDAKLYRVKTAKVWQRIKFLFTGNHVWLYER